VFWDFYRKTLPKGLDLGQRLYEQGELKTMRRVGAPAGALFDQLAGLLG
jgi:hypothetical protein